MFRTLISGSKFPCCFAPHAIRLPVLAALLALLGMMPAAALAQFARADQQQVRPIHARALGEADIAHILHNDLKLNRWSLLQIAPLEDLDGRMEIQLPIGGQVFDVMLATHSVLSPDFKLSLCSGAPHLGGRLTSVAPPAVNTYRGTVAQAPEAQVAATISDGQLDAFILLDGQANGPSIWYVQPLNRTISDAPPELHIVYNAADVRHHGYQCGGGIEVPPVHQRGEPPQVRGGGDGPDWFRVASLAIDADYAYFQDNGGDVLATVNDVQTIINNTSLIYELEVGVTFQINDLIIRQTDWPYIGGTTGFDLLDQFTNHWNANHQQVERALAHLFTGIDNRPILGVAWVATVCSPHYGYGYSQSMFTTNMVHRTTLTAHEIGHNFSARHCNQSPNICSPCGIMCSSISCATHGTFGCSAGVISTYAATRPCLGSMPVGEAITPPRAIAEAESWAYPADYTQVLSGNFHVTGFRLQASAAATGGWAFQSDMLMRLEAPDGTVLLVGGHGGDPVPGALAWNAPSLVPRGVRPGNTASAQNIDVVYSFDFGPVAGTWKVNFWNNWHGSGTLDWDNIRITPLVVGNDGACCLDTGACFVTSITNCDLLEGDFHGPGTVCSTACPLPTDVIVPPDFTALGRQWAFATPHIQYLSGAANVTGFRLEADAEPTGTAAYQSDLLMRLISPDGTTLLIGADQPPSIPGAVPWSHGPLNPTGTRPLNTPLEQQLDVTYTFPFGPMEGDWSVNFYNNYGGTGSAITWRNVRIRPLMDSQIGACCFPSGACAVRSPAQCASQGGSYRGDGVPCASANCEQPTGACCLTNGTCEVLTPAQCDSQNGSYRGHNVTCAMAQCSEPSGACCFRSGACEILSAAHCAAQNGAYQGDGVTCEAAQCPEIAGACCFSNGSCLVLTEAMCGIQSGIYQGDDVTCAAANCPPPQGACCLASGNCISASAVQCADLSGSYRGDGIPCSSANCIQPVGACCLPTGGCQSLTASTCNAQGGIYRGDGAQCSTANCLPSGACCFASGTCQLLTSSACTQHGGTYRGNGVTCEAAQCETPAGACCFADGSCEILTAAACDSQSGTYAGHNITCEAANCPQPTGACCLSNNTCSIMTAAQCETSNGLYMGDDVTCATANCVEPSGGCCFADGSCEVLTSAQCSTQGGAYAGNNVSCLAANCPQPTGACCYGDGSCQIRTSDECLATSGVYQGDGVDCAAANCQQPTGACCFGGGTCEMLTQSQCGGQSGNYMGDNITCEVANCPEPIRACCLPNGTCSMLTTSACFAQNGVVRAAGVSCVEGCADFGACCLSAGGCRMDVHAGCAMAGGTFAGYGVFCPDASCPETTGACCLLDGSCDVLTEAACVDQLGVYLGDNADCATANCPESCYADCDNNGTLNIDDFLCYINAFSAATMLPPSEQQRHYANCTGSTVEPILTIDDFLCFINEFASGCP